MKNGVAIDIFSDGKMTMEHKFGQAARMDKGSVMKTVDGQKIVMKGDEVARLDALLKQYYSGNR